MYSTYIKWSRGPYILMPGAGGKHRSAVGLALGYQERAKRKQSSLSRGRARVRKEGSCPKGSSNSKSTGRGQKKKKRVKVCRGLRGLSEHVLEWIWGPKRGARSLRSLYIARSLLRAWAVMFMAMPTREMEVLRLILKVWRHKYMAKTICFQECPAEYVVEFSRQVRVFIFS